MSIERKMIYDGRVIKVSVDTVELPNGMRMPLEIVRHPGGAAAVAIDAENRVCMLRQYRHAAGGYIYELPAGKLEPDEPPEVTARRELVEEGGGAAPREWTSARARISARPACSPRSSTCISRPAHAGDRGAGGGRGFPGGMVAPGAGGRAGPQRGTHRCEDHHRNSAGRSTKKNCVKRLTGCNSETPECWLCQTIEGGRRSYFAP